MKQEKFIKYLVPVWAVLHCSLFVWFIRVVTHRRGGCVAVQNETSQSIVCYDLTLIEGNPALAYTGAAFYLFAILIGLLALILAVMGFKKNAFLYFFYSITLLAVFNLVTFFGAVICFIFIDYCQLYLPAGELYITLCLLLAFILNVIFTTIALVLLAVRERHRTYQSPDTSISPGPSK